MKIFQKKQKSSDTLKVKMQKDCLEFQTLYENKYEKFLQNLELMGRIADPLSQSNIAGAKIRTASLRDEILSIHETELNKLLSQKADIEAKILSTTFEDETLPDIKSSGIDKPDYDYEIPPLNKGAKTKKVIQIKPSSKVPWRKTH